MTALNQQYVSEYGWVITLPPRWEQLEGSGSEGALIAVPPVVFATPDNWALSLTWMVAAGPVSPDSIEKFVTLTMAAGPLDPTEAQTGTHRIFPTMGELNEAGVVELEDGVMAIELLETFKAGQESKGGYQLIVPLLTGPGTISTFQRLCFYAPEGSFAKLLPDIRRSARSFHYTRVFGPPESEG
jgi:hypothetical protein